MIKEDIQLKEEWMPLELQALMNRNFWMKSWQNGLISILPLLSPLLCHHPLDFSILQNGGEKKNEKNKKIYIKNLKKFLF